MSVSPTSVRFAVVCAVLYGMLIAAIQLGLISRGEHSMVLLYWILMPAIWLLQKLPAGFLENAPVYLIAGLNVLLIFSALYGAAYVIGRIKKKDA
jgi:hypothetical protein